jgi:hypothetical protein
MRLEEGKSYRAKTACGSSITFTVISEGGKGWTNVELDEEGAIEPSVWLNTAMLIWISSEPKRKMAISKAADEVIEALETQR